MEKNKIFINEVYILTIFNKNKLNRCFYKDEYIFRNKKDAKRTIENYKKTYPFLNDKYKITNCIVENRPIKFDEIPF